MSPWLFMKLVKSNLPHLIGILIYGLIAIALALLCYKLFSKIIALNTDVEASAQDRLAAVILAVGSILAIAFLVAVTAYEPPRQAPFRPPARLSSVLAAACGNCGKVHPPGKAAAKKEAVTVTPAAGGKGASLAPAAGKNK